MTKDFLKRLPKEVWGILKLCAAKFISSFFKKQELWLISERGVDAKDNAYFFFLWLKQNHPEINSKYIISKESKDFWKFSSYMHDIVLYDSFNHYITLFKASHLISTHIVGYRPDIALFIDLDRQFNFLRKKKIVFLQHGIIVNDLKGLYANNVHLDLFICGARPEYEYICSKFGYKDGVVRYTGLCRYDNLASFETNKQILIMPTWRMYLSSDNFVDSEYYIRYKSLISNSKFHNMARNYGYKIIFYPHHEVQKYVSLFKDSTLPNNVVIADQSYDVQTLLKESDILITDYSSVYFDFAYMRKPVIFYQFDKSDFFSKHYKKGYFNESSFGPVVANESELISEIDDSLRKHCFLKEEYLFNINAFFDVHDIQNCLRVFNAITSL